MYKNARVVLKNITKLINNGTSEEANSFDYLVYFRPSSEKDFLDALHCLQSENLITITDDPDVPSVKIIRLTPEGRTYPERRKQEIITTFLKSIFCPIVVAFFTTLITLGLDHMFQ